VIVAALLRLEGDCAAGAATNHTGIAIAININVSRIVSSSR
jgi:hypothetical protein